MPPTAKELLQDKLLQVNDTTKTLVELRALLQQYRDTRQQYADLVVSTKADLDLALDNNAIALQELRDALLAAYPVGP